MKKITWTTAILLLSLFVGCAGTPKELEQLEDTMRAYERAIRWGDYDLASKFRKDTKADEIVKLRKRLKPIRVTSYRVVYSKVESDHKTAEQVVDISYYHEEYAVERSITDKQKWEYDSDSEHWILASPLPQFK